MPVSGDRHVTTGLGGAKGVGEIEVPRNDDGTMKIDVSAVFEDGFNIFGTSHSAETLFVNTNGTISFGTAFTEMPTAQNTQPPQDILAPFWGDVDTRLDGEGAESGSIWVDIDASADVVSITWEDVGVFRRSAEDTNTFQVQIYDRGDGDFDVAFRYQSLTWSQGTAVDDAGARAGFVAGDMGTSGQWIDTLDSPITALDSMQGNTGVVGLWVYEFRDNSVEEEASPPEGDNYTPDFPPEGGTYTGTSGNDILRGSDGDDVVWGLNGSDTLVGGDGDDVLVGGQNSGDVRDVIYGGEGNDSIDGGYGNDELRGDAGNDTLAGGFGADTVIAGTGDDVLTGGAFGDMMFGGDGFDFINGGFGFDRVNGGEGADKFYHLGIADHGSDWIQDYDSAEGDILFYGGGSAAVSDFLVQTATTATAGVDGVAEAFVTHIPSGNLLWALVDGDGQSEINIQIGGEVFDLLS